MHVSLLLAYSLYQLWLENRAWCLGMDANREPVVALRKQNSQDTLHLQAKGRALFCVFSMNDLAGCGIATRRKRQWLQCCWLHPSCRVHAGVISWRGTQIDVDESDVQAYIDHGAALVAAQSGKTSKGWFNTDCACCLRLCVAVVLLLYYSQPEILSIRSCLLVQHSPYSRCGQLCGSVPSWRCTTDYKPR